jgi:hypothetical protein
VRKLFLALLLAIGLLPASAQAPPPVPALPDSERRTSYTITGTTCACAVGFQIYGDGTDFANWIDVWLNGVNVSNTDPTFGWTLTSPTGPLSSIARPITDAIITFNAVQTGTVQIVGARRPRRVSQFPESRGVTARDFNQALTDLVAQNREIWDKTNDMTGRGLFYAPGNTTGPMPSAAACANMMLGFDATGLNPICTTGGGGGGLPTPVRAGDVPYWNGAAWATLAGNNLGTNCFSENGSGTPSWASCTGGGGGGGVSSTSPTVVGHIATYNDTVGGTITDSGISLTSQAAKLFLATPSGASGVPSFRALVGADLPNPSASTLGGVQSIAVIAHQFVTGISTSGVPTSAQPAFTDISGQISNAQGPTDAANTVRGNFTGSATPPIGNAMPSCSASNQALKYTSGAGIGCLSYSPAATQTTPGAGPYIPNSTSAFKMQGLAGTITPATTGNVLITISGTIVAASGTAAGTGVKYSISYGTGAAPGINATLTGTQVGGVQQATADVTYAAAGLNRPFSVSAVVSLTVGTTYWIDLAAESQGTANQWGFATPSVAAMEN